MLAGRGFGMSEIKNIVKKNNGKIGIGTKIGTGTKFTITWPMKK
jgi:chemotaxis protein histidine kinase CheA